MICINLPCSVIQMCCRGPVQSLHGIRERTKKQDVNNLHLKYALNNMNATTSVTVIGMLRGILT